MNKNWEQKLLRSSKWTGNKRSLKENSSTWCTSKDVNANLEPLGVAERRQGS